MKWKLEILDLYDKTGLGYNVELFCTLSDVWQFLGFKLHKQTFGYNGQRNGIVYRLIRW